MKKTIVKSSKPPQPKVACWESVDFKPKRYEFGLNVSVISNSGPFAWKINDLEIPKYPINYETIQKHENALIKVNQNIPTLIRHYESLSSLDLNLRQIIMQSLSLMQSLKNNRVKVVVFPTASSHHLDSLILETACELAGVKQVFLKETILKNRIIPMLQTKGWESTSPLNFKISKFELSKNPEDLHELIAENLNTIVWNEKYIENYYLASIHLVINQLRIYKNNFKQRIFFSPEKVIEDLEKRSLITKLRLYRTQNKALNLLRKYVSDDIGAINSYLNECIKSNSLPLILFAHFQPEATTFPDGGKYYNHIDLICELRAHGFKSQIIYKEHPATNLYGDKNFTFEVGTYRDTNYYEILRKLGCLFADSNLIDSLEEFIPITITGSIALQRSLNGKQTVVAGRPWFSELPGLISLDEFKYHAPKYLRARKNGNNHSPRIAYNVLRKIINRKTCMNFREDTPEARVEYENLIRKLTEI